MRRSILALALTTTAALAACDAAEVVVTAEIQQAGATEGEVQTVTLGDLEVALVPFDRDEIFDSLEAAAATPQPPIPEPLLAAQEQISEAQEQWQAAESRWAQLRDSLQALGEELEQYNRGEARYVALFREFGQLEDRYAQVERVKDQAFARYDSLEQATTRQMQEVRLQREAWADDAFADVGTAFEARLDEIGREIRYDTTSAQGVVRFPSVPPGQWYVHARYELPFSELYWNVPVEVPSGETVQVQLTRETAQVRPKL